MAKIDLNCLIEELTVWAYYKWASCNIQDMPGMPNTFEAGQRATKNEVLKILEKYKGKNQ